MLKCDYRDCATHECAFCGDIRPHAASYPARTCCADGAQVDAARIAVAAHDYNVRARLGRPDWTRGPETAADALSALDSDVPSSWTERARARTLEGKVLS